MIVTSACLLIPEENTMSWVLPIVFIIESSAINKNPRCTPIPFGRNWENLVIENLSFKEKEINQLCILMSYTSLSNHKT